MKSIEPYIENMRYILVNGVATPEKDLNKWATWLGDINNKRIKQYLINDVRVSTVFLGINHNFGGNGDPILFETLVFGGKYNDEMYRYCTKEEAIKGHDKITLKVAKSESNALDFIFKRKPTRTKNKKV